jgi:hypothetical protein
VLLRLEIAAGGRLLVACLLAVAVPLLCRAPSLKG